VLWLHGVGERHGANGRGRGGEDFHVVLEEVGAPALQWMCQWICLAIELERRQDRVAQVVNRGIGRRDAYGEALRPCSDAVDDGELWIEWDT
jgi:hypothetical protein